MRGEHTLAYKPGDTTLGSSPHARGTHNALLAAIIKAGIIPACAGNTWQSEQSRLVAGDHPRMRGEHIDVWLDDFMREGSSPHARGTRRQWRGHGQSAGIIPACAGNTNHGRGFLRCRRDHPRMRGEHQPRQRHRRGDWGSSPHARGTLDGGSRKIRQHGIIPACAGNTCAILSAPPSPKDHPRMRGEHGQTGAS